MDVEVILEWQFTPTDCLERPVNISTPIYSLTIEAGSAIAKLDPVYYDANPSVKALLEGEIRSRLAGAQLFTHAPFELTRPVVGYVRDDGTRRPILDAEAGAFAVSASSLDLQVHDAGGHVVRDTKQERVSAKAAAGALISKHRSDATLKAMLCSLDAAMRDPDNELIHLYEIRDALAARLGGKDTVCQAVGVSAADWSRMGKLCCVEPLRQGRHRGENFSLLRDATATELGEARSIAVSMIRGYIDYLERSGP